MTNLEKTINRISENPDIYLNVELISLVVEIMRLRKENVELTECLRWYVENDDTNEGGMWDKINSDWLEGKRRAMRALGMEE